MDGVRENEIIGSLINAFHFVDDALNEAKRVVVTCGNSRPERSFGLTLNQARNEVMAVWPNAVPLTQAHINQLQLFEDQIHGLELVNVGLENVEVPVVLEQNDGLLDEENEPEVVD
ncbi:hypothetical protein L484_009093 [Morus notabilis]|uniref:Uncharacterized protein n=1 Tax=Morus notabilis TaxID=981085 RepID=W9QQV6_9ROSA|nr:hypothetical protein L484_009093 [Morus notabilis]